MSAQETVLWIPGNQLADQYPAMTQPELNKAWSDVYGQDATHSTDPILGVVSEPTSSVERAASIDLCEVVRDTHVALAIAAGKERGGIAHFGQYYATLGLGKGQEATVTTVIMNAGYVRPVPEIADIRTILQTWRKEGIYTIANIATLPGCEKVTIEFLAEHLPDCFDGIVFPRGHDGTAAYTKADALGIALQTATGAGRTVERLVHIDDAPHHIEAIIRKAGQLTTGECMAIMPVYPGNVPHSDRAYTAASPLQAFAQADEFLRA